MSILMVIEEKLVSILSSLSPSDRLESALTCRRWAQTVARAPPLLRDIWLDIRADRWKEAETVFANSHRQYENLRLVKVPLLNFNAAFWTNVGPSLRKLEIIGCELSPKVFYSILQTCSKLESLETCDPCLKGTKLPPGIELESIQNSMRNLRHLQLGFFVKAHILEYLFILMPNVSSIDLWRFDRRSGFLRRLPNILGPSRRITLLHFDSRYVMRDECEELLRISSPSLQTLVYASDVPGAIEPNALRNCPMLRDLTLRQLYTYDTPLLNNMIRNSPDLESLSISRVSLSEPLGREDLMVIFNLRKLRKLHLEIKVVTGSSTCVPYEIMDDLSRMISLESLTVGRELGTVDSTRFRIFASLPNLRKLVIGRVQWDTECLRIVLFDLGKLKALKINGVLSNNEPVLPDRHFELEQNISSPQDHSKSDRLGEQKFSSLEILEIIDIPLSDACLGLIAAHHDRLRTVYFLRCHNITDAGLVTLSQHEPLLETLEVYQMDNVDGTFLGALGELCRRLRSIGVGVESKISSQAWEKFKLRRPRVKRVM